MTWKVVSQFQGTEYVMRSNVGTEENQIYMNDAAQRLFAQNGVIMWSDSEDPMNPYRPTKPYDVATAYLAARYNFPGFQVVTGTPPIEYQGRVGDVIMPDLFPGENKKVASGTKVLPAMQNNGSDHTGAMIALIPDDDSIQRIKHIAGDRDEDLHLTIAFMSEDATMWTDAQRDLVQAIAATVLPYGAINANIGGAGTLGDSEPPASVYIVGDSPVLQFIMEDVFMRLNKIDGIVPIKPQRIPWLPHVTAGWGLDPKTMTYRGPIRFDKFRVAMGGQHVDYELDPMPTPEQVRGASMDVQVAGKSFHLIDSGSDQYSAAEAGFKAAYLALSDADLAEVKGDGAHTSTVKAPKCKFCSERATKGVVWAEGMAVVPACDSHLEKAKAAVKANGKFGDIDRIRDYRKEPEKKDVAGHASADPRAVRLRVYWTRGPGAAKIRWGVPGDFKRAVRQLRKYVGARAEGLAAIYHHSALGVWPGREGGGKSLWTASGPHQLVARSIMEEKEDAR